MVGDADQPGQDGVAKFASAVAGIASEVRVVPLPYVVIENHGKDVRDYFVDGNTFDQLRAIADAAPLTIPTVSEQEDHPEAAENKPKMEHLLTTSIKRLRDGWDFDGRLKHHNAELAKITPDQSVSFEIMTSAELDAADLHTEYLVEGVLAAGQPCIIAASKKSLKTTTAIDLTLSLASGAKFLNEFYVTRPVRVALMSGESGDAVIQETARRIARSKSWFNLADYENAIWSFQLPRLGQPTTKKQLTKFIQDHALAVLIIDPAYLCLDLGEDAGNLFSVGKKLAELSEVGRDTKCTIIIIHHNRKGNPQNPFAPPELESIAWSGFQEWARQWILLGRREAYDPEQGGSHKLWLCIGGSAGHSGQWAVDVEEGNISDEVGRHWDVAIQGASSAIAKGIESREQVKAAKANEKIEGDAAKILKNYQRHPGGETKNILKDEVGMSGPSFTVANDRLVDRGLLVACTVMKNREQPAYRLSDGTRTTRTALGQGSDDPSASESRSSLGQLSL